MSKMKCFVSGEPIVHSAEGVKQKGTVKSVSGDSAVIALDDSGSEMEVPLESLQTADCYNCAYRAGVPGSAHSRCRFDFSECRSEIPKPNSMHPVNRGWWLFPLNYDPIWMDGHCSKHSLEQDPAKVAGADAFGDLLALLAQRM